MAFWNKDSNSDSDEPTDSSKTPAPPPPASPSPRKEKTMAREEKQTGEINALLGRGASFEGKLSFEGTVRIDGNFKGEIFTDDILVIGDGAKVEAEIRAGSVNVNGEVKGNITATKGVDLHRPAKVIGNITTPTLEIEKGVIFEGSCSMKTGGASASNQPQKNKSNDSSSSASSGGGQPQKNV